MIGFLPDTARRMTYLVFMTTTTKTLTSKDLANLLSPAIADIVADATGEKMVAQAEMRTYDGSTFLVIEIAGKLVTVRVSVEDL